MMKKLLFTIVLITGSIFSYAQSTYYWVGGATASSLAGTTWSLTPGGTAVSRSNTSDVLIFDNVTVAIELGNNTIGKLIVQNGADISFERTTGAAAGTSTLTLGGISGEGLLVDNAKLRLKGSTSSAHNFFLTFTAGITGSVINNGQVYITGTGSNRMTLPTAGQLVFESGTACFVNSAGNPFNQAGTSAQKAVVFKSGSSLTYQGGLNPFGNNAAAYVADMQTGSTLIMEAANVANIFNGKVLGNVTIAGTAAVALSENFISIDNLTIDAGGSFLLRGSGAAGIVGNIVNNGTFGINGAISSSQLIMMGSSAQTISGSGTFNNLGCFTVGTDASVTLNRSLVLAGTSTSNVIGSLNFLGNTLSGTNSLQFRNSASTSALGATDATTNIIQMADAAAYAALAPVPGLLISGPGIPANTYVIGTASGTFNFTISKFPTATASGVTISGLGNAPTFITSNAAGVDGSLTTTKTLSTATNYIFNAATTTPFASNALTGNSAVNVTFNAAATLNKNMSITGKLALDNVKLTIPTGTQLSISSTGTFDGTFNQSAYIATAANTGTGAVGLLKVSIPASATLVPVGTANYYTPITLTPTTASAFDINVFEGVTNNATPNGTAVSATAKQTAVDAVWNVNRTSGTGNVDMTLGWQAAQEGSGFTALLNNEIGIAQYVSGDYTAFSGMGNNTANTATNNFATLTQFAVGKVGATLPIELISFNAKKQGSAVQLNWATASEQKNDYFNVERSVDGNNFSVIGRRNGAGNSTNTNSYAFTDYNPLAGINYYRLTQFDTDGKGTATLPIFVNMGAEALSLKVLQGVNPSELNMNFISPSQLSGQFLVYNLSGQKLLSKPLFIESGNSSINVGLPMLAPGVYIAVYQAGDQVVREKFIK